MHGISANGGLPGTEKPGSTKHMEASSHEPNVIQDQEGSKERSVGKSLWSTEMEN